MVKKLVCIILLALSKQVVHSQNTDTSKFYVNGSVSLTNNGISFIPSFSLGKPATMVNLYIGKDNGKLSFEPEFRYALSGKPWAVIFIWRYKLVRSNKFNLTVGTHLPYLVFRSTTVIDSAGNKSDNIQAQRYFPVLETYPSYNLSKNTTIGIYYMYGIGLETNIPKHSQFISFRSNFASIKLSKAFYLKGMAQAYYLKLDKRDGFYTALNVTLAKSDFPISISSLVNKKLDSDIPGKNFDWNVSVNYSFKTKFVKAK